MRTEGPLAGSCTLKGSVDSERRGLAGSEVSAVASVEGRTVLSCWPVLDVTRILCSSLANCTHISNLLSARSRVFRGSIRLSWRVFPFFFFAQSGSQCCC